MCVYIFVSVCAYNTCLYVCMYDSSYILIGAEEVELGDICGGAAVEPIPERCQTQVLRRSRIPTTGAVVVVYGCPELAILSTKPGYIPQARQCSVDDGVHHQLRYVPHV